MTHSAAPSSLGLLLSIAENRHPAKSEDLALTVSQMCIDDMQPLSPSESLIAYDILQRIYPDAEMHVRRMLADRFSLRPETPHQLVMMLANDSIEIARPVIMHSPVLQEDDLIRICVDCSRMHRLCVAVRPELSSKVTDILVYMDDERVQLALVRNRKAKFSPHAIKHLAVHSKDCISLQEPLLHRPEMTSVLASLMYRWVGESLKRFINEAFGPTAAQKLSREVTQTANSALAERLERARTSSGKLTTFAPSAGLLSAEDPPERSQETAPPESVTPLLQAVRRNDYNTIEREMHLLTDLDHQSILKILYHNRGEALAVICHALNIGRVTFSEVFCRLHSPPPYSRFLTTTQFTNTMTAYDRLSPRLAQHTVTGWKEHPETVWGDWAIENYSGKRRQQELREASAANEA